MLKQRSEARRQGQTTAGGGLGLGSNVAKRLHGLAVVWYIRTDEGPGQGLVQTPDPGGGRVLQRPGARGRRRPVRTEDEGAGTFGTYDPASCLQRVLLLFFQCCVYF